MIDDTGKCVSCLHPCLSKIYFKIQECNSVLICTDSSQLDDEILAKNHASEFLCSAAEFINAMLLPNLGDELKSQSTKITMTAIIQADTFDIVFQNILLLLNGNDPKACQTIILSAHHILHYLIDMEQFHGYLALILYHSVMASHSGLQYESLDYLLGLIADVCFHLGKASSLPFEVLSKINNDTQEISNYLQEIGRMALSKDRVRLTKQFLKNILGQPTSKLFAQDPNFLRMSI